MPSFSRILEQTLHTALAYASTRRHEYSTLEHLLLALTEDPDAVKMLNDCKVPLGDLRKDIVHYLDEELSALVVEGPSAAETDPAPTKGFQEVVQKSILDVQRAGIDEITGAHLLVSLMSRRDSYAVSFLQKYGVQYIDLLSMLPATLRAAAARDDSEPTPELRVEVSDRIHKIFRNDLKAISDGVAAEPVLYTPNIAKQVVRLALDVVEDAANTSRVAFNEKQALLTIGLYGPWGSGKSTLLRAIGKELSVAGMITVSVNTWMWDESEDVHGFVLAELLRSLSTRRETRWRARFVRFMLFWRTHSWRVAAWAALLAAILSIAVSVNWTREITSSDVTKSSVLALATAVIVAVLAKPLGTLVESVLFLKGKEGSPKETLTKSYEYLRSIATWNIERRTRPIAFLFDDLDRCSEDGVVRFFQSIHLLTGGGSICVVACDEDFVSAAIYSKFKNVADYLDEGRKFGRRFLEKIVQIPFRLPEVTQEDLLELGLGIGSRQVGARSVGEGPDDLSSDEATAHLIQDLEPAGFSGSVSEIRLSEISGSTLALLVEPCHLQIRQIKMLSNIVKLYAMIFPPTDETAAERLAAFIIATYVDPKWIPCHYFGEETSESYVSPLSAAKEELIRRLGDDKIAIERLYRLCGAPRD